MKHSVTRALLCAAVLVLTGCATQADEPLLATRPSAPLATATPEPTATLALTPTTVSQLPKPWTLLYTTDVNGYVDPCG